MDSSLPHKNKNTMNWTLSPYGQKPKTKKQTKKTATPSLRKLVSQPHTTQETHNQTSTAIGL
jgi:hypothetical protein